MKEKDLTLRKHSKVEADLGRSGKATVLLCACCSYGCTNRVHLVPEMWGRKG